MMTRISAILLSGAIGITLSGCAATSPTMRGQSPDSSFSSYGDGMIYTDASCQTCDSGYGAQCQPTGRRGKRAKCRRDNPCRQKGCQSCLNLPCHPVHRNFQTYDVPRGLTYPQQQAQPATYQYPYYTFRGPTDFFMK